MADEGGGGVQVHIVPLGSLDRCCCPEPVVPHPVPALIPPGCHIQDGGPAGQILDARHGECGYAPVDDPKCILHGITGDAGDKIDVIHGPGEALRAVVEGIEPVPRSPDVGCVPSEDEGQLAVEGGISVPGHPQGQSRGGHHVVDPIRKIVLQQECLDIVPNIVKLRPADGLPDRGIQEEDVRIVEPEEVVPDLPGRIGVVVQDEQDIVVVQGAGDDRMGQSIPAPGAVEGDEEMVLPDPRVHPEAEGHGISTGDGQVLPEKEFPAVVLPPPEDPDLEVLGVVRDHGEVDIAAPPLRELQRVHGNLHLPSGRLHEEDGTHKEQYRGHDEWQAG